MIPRIILATSNYDDKRSLLKTWEGKLPVSLGWVGSLGTCLDVLFHISLSVMGLFHLQRMIPIYPGACIKRFIHITFPIVTHAPFFHGTYYLRNPHGWYQIAAMCVSLLHHQSSSLLPRHCYHTACTRYISCYSSPGTSTINQHSATFHTWFLVPFFSISSFSIPHTLYNVTTAPVPCTAFLDLGVAHLPLSVSLISALSFCTLQRIDTPTIVGRSYCYPFTNESIC